MRRIALLPALVLVAASGCAAPLSAQAPWQVSSRPVAFERGYDRGVRAGMEDWRRREAYQYVDEIEYRRADEGYRRDYGSLERYKDEFRRGYRLGYRDGYEGERGAPYAGPPRSGGRAVPRDARVSRDPAFQNGYADGYQAGFDDARARRRADPVGHRRYRSGDRGYDRRWGPRDDYARRYRDGFIQGYRAGYADGRR